MGRVTFSFSRLASLRKTTFYISVPTNFEFLSPS